MDLAKIRKKSLQAVDTPSDESAIIPESLLALINSLEAVPTATDSSEVDCFQKELVPKPIVSKMDVVPSNKTIIPERVETCTPLEAIMAGRGAAGCDFETNIADEATSEVLAEAYLEFLCFRVSDEIYGINIMDIKEIIKPREVTEIPRAPVFVSGVLSLRGTIIPVIDMRVRLDLARQQPTGKERIVVIKNNNSFSGLMVDEVTQVVQVQLDDVEAAPAILDGIDRDFVSGLGRSNGQLIIILNLENIADINMY
jgi:purine-binding chemotaxis protein CheW